MKDIRWDLSKNEELKTQRHVSFDEIEAHITTGEIWVIDNPSSQHRGQRAFLVEIDHYMYVVPFVETEDEIFLKTIFPSRAMTKKYLRGGKDA